MRPARPQSVVEVDMKRFALFSLLFLVTMSAASIAQVGTQSSVTGTVADSTGAAVPKAQVVVTNVATGETKQVTTGPTGDFTVLALPAGIYRVSVEASGF